MITAKCKIEAKCINCYILLTNGPCAKCNKTAENVIKCSWVAYLMSTHWNTTRPYMFALTIMFDKSVSVCPSLDMKSMFKRYVCIMCVHLCARTVYLYIYTKDCNLHHFKIAVWMQSFWFMLKVNCSMQSLCLK